MGMERVITFHGAAPRWESLQQEFAASGLKVSIRMIDGLPAFPDEVPAEGWGEVRIGISGAMITLRLSPGKLSVMTWGNADEDQRREWEAVAQACARAAKGTILGTG